MAFCAIKLVRSNVGVHWIQHRVKFFVLPCERKGSREELWLWVTRSSQSTSWGGAATRSPVQDWAWRLELADCKYFTEVLFSGNYFNMIQCFLFCLILLMSLCAWSFPCCRGSRASIPMPSVPFLLCFASWFQWLRVGAFWSMVAV